MNAFTVTKHGRSRHWAVHDPAGELVCLCVYKRGAVEVIRRLTCGGPAEPYCLRETPPEAVGAGEHGFVAIPLDTPSPSPERGSRSVHMDNKNTERRTA